MNYRRDLVWYDGEMNEVGRTRDVGDHVDVSQADAPAGAVTCRVRLLWPDRPKPKGADPVAVDWRGPEEVGPPSSWRPGDSFNGRPIGDPTTD